LGGSEVINITLLPQLKPQTRPLNTLSQALDFRHHPLLELRGDIFRLRQHVCRVNQEDF
jgi:hypothetical protein